MTLTQPESTHASTDARRLVLAVVIVLVVAVLAASIWELSGPRDQIPVPGVNAKPVEVVRAYVDAINARDFDTANAIDARGSDLGRFSRPGRIEDLHVISVDREGRNREQVHVLFKADMSGMGPSMENGSQEWGYYLERGDDGRWRIVDAGVA